MVESKNFMNNMRGNIFQKLGELNITLWELSEKADMPFPTLRTMLYGKSMDIMTSNAIKLANALDISIEELLDSHSSL